MVLFAACSESLQKIQRKDADYKYEKAKEFYEDGNYAKALPLFEELITVYKGTKSVDEIYYMYAMCHYHSGNFLVAGFHFKNIRDSYSLSTYAEESLYMFGYCYYRLSPATNLDQTYTEKAMEALQLYINSYPNTERLEQCNLLIEQLRRKLEIKAYKNASLYLRIRDYKAAAVAFNNVLKNFPDTEDAEDIQFLIIKSYYEYAIHSYESKQRERYDLALDAYKIFAAKYPNSELMKEATQLRDQSLSNIEKLQVKK